MSRRSASPIASRGRRARPIPRASRRPAGAMPGRRAASPGSDLAFMQQQHLDPNNVALGILNPLTSGQGAQNPDLSAAITHATNEWQIAEWTSRDSRLKGVGGGPVRGCRRLGEGDRTARRRPEFRPGDVAEPDRRTAGAAALLADLSRRPPRPACRSASTPSAMAAGRSPPAAGRRIYIEEMVGHAQAQQAVLTSLILEGVFERLPNAEGRADRGRPRLGRRAGWRMDAQWKKLKQELPHLKRAAVGIHAHATSGSPRSRSRSRSRASNWPKCSTGSAGTASCSPPTTRIGITTTRARAADPDDRRRSGGRCSWRMRRRSTAWRRRYLERPAPSLGLAKLLLPIDGELDPKAKNHHDRKQEVEMSYHPNLPDTPARGIPGRRFHF